MKVVCGILIWNSSVLVGKRKLDNKSYPGQWEFPGGKIEPNEDAYTAVKREWKEELDLEVQPFHKLRTLTKDEIEFSTFTLTLVSGKAKLLDHDEVRFVDNIEFSKLKLTPLSKEAGRMFFDSYSIFLNQRE